MLLSTMAVHLATAELTAEYAETVHDEGTLETTTAAAVLTDALEVLKAVADVFVVVSVWLAVSLAEEVAFLVAELVFFDEVAIDDEAVLADEVILEDAEVFRLKVFLDTASTGTPTDEKDAEDAEELEVEVCADVDVVDTTVVSWTR